MVRSIFPLWTLYSFCASTNHSQFFLFIFNCTSVSLYKLSTVGKSSTFTFRIPRHRSSFLTDLLFFLCCCRPSLFQASLFFSFLILLLLFLLFFLLQCIEVTRRGSSINCFLLGRLDRMTHCKKDLFPFIRLKPLF